MPAVVQPCAMMFLAVYVWDGKPYSGCWQSSSYEVVGSLCRLAGAYLWGLFKVDTQYDPPRCELFWWSTCFIVCVGIPVQHRIIDTCILNMQGQSFFFFCLLQEFRSGTTLFRIFVLLIQGCEKAQFPDLNPVKSRRIIRRTDLHVGDRWYSDPILNR